MQPSSHEAHCFGGLCKGYLTDEYEILRRYSHAWPSSILYISRTWIQLGRAVNGDVLTEASVLLVAILTMVTRATLARSPPVPWCSGNRTRLLHVWTSVPAVTSERSWVRIPVESVLTFRTMLPFISSFSFGEVKICNYNSLILTMGYLCPASRI